MVASDRDTIAAQATSHLLAIGITWKLDVLPADNDIACIALTSPLLRFNEFAICSGVLCVLLFTVTTNAPGVYDLSSTQHRHVQDAHGQHRWTLTAAY